LAASEAKFVPLFVWFERLTHYVLQEYLYRVITPDLNKQRAARRDDKNAIFAKIQGLSPSAVQSLKSLTDIIVPLLQLRGFVGPQIPNREWAVDETAIKSLLEADLIAGNGSMDGKSCLKDQWIGEIVGQHFFGENNPFKGNKILAPRH
jgi:hypothetical protein